MRSKVVWATIASSLVALTQLRCGSQAPGRESGSTVGAGGSGEAPDAGVAGDAGQAGNDPNPGTGGSGIVVVERDGSAVPVDGSDLCVDAASCSIGCGNGKIDPGLVEACDDGNNTSGDGCSADCKAVEKDWACPKPGTACVYLVKCGDGRIGGKETCDDTNTTDGDGCSSTCSIEKGWDCPQAGQRCVPHCGDGMLAGVEQCDPPNVGMGCSATCQFEPGSVCTPPPAVANPAQPAQCHKTSCGDGTKEGSEACDDGNNVDGDGCSGSCTFEPDCSTSPCSSKCGDGMRLAQETCDDGNTRDGDGCSHDCKTEPGYACVDTTVRPPAKLSLGVTFRDFISIPTNGGTRHPDFEAFADARGTKNLVLGSLDTEGKPAIEGRCSELQPATWTNTAICPYGQQLTNEVNFKQWYRDTPGVNITIKSALLLPRLADGSYVYDSTTIGFFPLDGKGWTAAPIKELLAKSLAGVNDGLNHNFGFTTEVRYFFQYRGGEVLAFSGDDDVWVFVNRKLGLDLGGKHPRQDGTLDMDQSATLLGLVIGNIYEVDLFHAERHTDSSNFKLTLTGFAPTSSTCGSTCGDGIVAGTEWCDLGKDMNTGGYNGCTSDCRRGPFCGDGVVQPDHEPCDDGVNITIYSANGAPGCSPGCMPSAYCGDGKLDGLFGEQCDLGKDMNTGAYDGCTATCQLGPRCGDGTVQKDAGEQCDDGNTVSADGCTQDCKNEIVP